MSRRTFDSVTVGQSLPTVKYSVNREMLIAYANASGDQNPIHQDEAFAKSVGLPDVIAHGMFTMASAGRALTDFAGDPGAIVEFSTRFTKPVVVPAGQDVVIEISGTVAEKLDDRLVRIELQVTCGGVKVLGMTRAIVALA
ncbi:MAG TPA: MaoC family dehydratase [Candidatus Nanopelagicaceae bacterium]|nr:MaoC family dehydratase [Candidatus Nanopelagicaceae bacterium]